MRLERRSGTDEKRILIGMIVDNHVLGRIAGLWPDEGGRFASGWANLVAGWCVGFYKRYGTAPGPAIEPTFATWAERGKDADTVAIIEKFLEGLSDEYETEAKEINPDYTLDLAANHFNRVALLRLKEEMEGDIDAGDITAAIKRVETYGRVQLAQADGIDPFQNEEALVKAFDVNREPLIRYPGALGEFFKDIFERDGFVGLMAPEKRGKTWWLLDIAYRAVLQRRKTVFFSVGDMSQSQVIRRLGARAARHPLKPRSVRVPTGITREMDEKYAAVTSEERVYEEGLSAARVQSAFKQVMATKVKSKETYLKLACYPNSTINVAGIRTVLAGWEREGWVADVVVIDYADILAPPAGTVESRDQINATWKQLRALSQEYHNLVVTATQSDAASYDSETLGRRNFSEDKRKFAHVTAMVGINAVEAEKAQGVFRLNTLVMREDEYLEAACVHVAGCLALGNPAIKSCF
jgi:hypothetical protein